MKNFITKNIPLLIVFSVLVAVYQFGISKTIYLYIENKSLDDQLNRALTADEEIFKLNNDVHYLKKQLWL